jgi:metal-responsive CopG/Arc/MetJ family transcriptional regulator
MPGDNTKNRIRIEVTLPDTMAEQLREVAQKNGNVGVGALARLWLADRLQEESPGWQPEGLRTPRHSKVKQPA